MNDLMLNSMPAPYRRDLSGDDFVYEIGLLYDKMQEGDVLSFPLCVLARLPGLSEIPKPNWSWEIWHEPANYVWKIKRLPARRHNLPPEISAYGIKS